MPDPSPPLSDEQLLLLAAEEEITRLKEDFQALEALVLEHIDESDDEKLKSLRALYARLRAEFDQLKTEPAPASAELVAERNALADQLSVLQQDAWGLQQQVAEAIRYRKETERRFHEQETARERAAFERTQLEQNLRHRNTQVNELQEELSRARRETERLRREEQTARLQLEAERRGTKALETRANTLARTLAQHEADKEEEAIAQTSLRTALAATQKQYQELRQQHDMLARDAHDAQQLADEAGNDRARLLAEVEALRNRSVPSDAAREYLTAFQQVKGAFDTLAGHAQRLEHLLTAPVQVPVQAPRAPTPSEEVPRLHAALRTLTEQLAPLNERRPHLEERYQQLTNVIRQANLDLRTTDRGSALYTKTSTTLATAEQELAPVRTERDSLLRTIDTLHGHIQLLRHRLDIHKALEEPIEPLLILPIIEERPSVERTVTIPPPPPPPVETLKITEPIRPLTPEDLELRLRETAELNDSSVTAIIAITLLKAIRQKPQDRQLLVTTEALFHAAIEIGALENAFQKTDFERIDEELKRLPKYVTKTVTKGKMYFPFVPNKHLHWDTFLTKEQIKALVARLRAQE